MDYIQVTTTASSKKDAQTIGKTLVEKRLAACVQIIGPITSIYRWKGAVEQAEEYQCVIKTRADRFAALRQAIREIHPYDLPEIIAAPVIEGDEDYLHWVDAAVEPGHKVG